ncbi:MAG: Rne/Rng family ribonuclease [bacterium]
MKRQIIVNATLGEKRIAIIEDKKLVELHIARSDTKYCLGNIYSGVVKRVLPGMQAAFVEFGGARTGFIFINDLKSDVTYEEFQKSIKEESGDEPSENQKNSHEKKDISNYVKEGEKILVQVIKEPIGQKGARLTTHISLPGRFCVLLPTILHIGVSRKITDCEKREELKKLGEKVGKKGYGIILRTLACQSSLKVVEKEIVALIKKWGEIQNAFKKEKNAVLIHESLDPLTEIIQSSAIEEFEKIVVDSREDEKRVKNYLRFYDMNPDEHIKFHDLPYPIFDYYSIEAEIDSVLKKKIWLKSGGFLIIEQTEALTVIDVNTGKFVGKGSLESTVLKTNLEAAEEIAYHLRLRNIAGIIVVDFIDMRNHSSKKKVVSELEKELRKDPAKCSVFYFTRLGLVQITRKRTTESNISSMTEPCPYCNGNGIIKSRDTVVFQVLREMTKEARLYQSSTISITAHPDIIFALEHKYSEEFNSLKKELKIFVETQTDNTFHREHFIVSPRDKK